MIFLGYKPSTLILWAVLSLPALTMVGPLFGDDAQAFHRLLHPTGEWAARFMIIGMMASALLASGISRMISQPLYPTLAEIMIERQRTAALTPPEEPPPATPAQARPGVATYTG